MNITEVHVRLNPKGKLRAFASITVDGWFAARGLKVIEKANGSLFVAMPTRDDNGRDICHPISKEGRAYLTEKILAAYAEASEGTAEHAANSNSSAYVH